MRFTIVRRSSSGPKFISKSPKNVLLPASLITLGVTGTVSMAEKNYECKQIARKMQRGLILGKSMFIENESNDGTCRHFWQWEINYCRAFG